MLHIQSRLFTWLCLALMGLPYASSFLCLRVSPMGEVSSNSASTGMTRVHLASVMMRGGYKGTCPRTVTLICVHSKLTNGEVHAYQRHDMPSCQNVSQSYVECDTGHDLPWAGAGCQEALWTWISRGEVHFRPPLISGQWRRSSVGTST
jgi:hypothetical protein